MGMPNGKVIEFPLNEAGDTVVVGEVEVHVTDMVQAFDYVRGTGAGYTATLEGSVARNSWTQINDLTVTAQGEISAIYHYIRLKVTVQGAVGTGNSLMYHGKS